MLAHSLNAPSTRIVPVAQPNKVKTITKLANGSLRVEFHSGQVGEYGPQDELFQAFLVYSVIANI